MDSTKDLKALHEMCSFKLQLLYYNETKTFAMSRVNPSAIQYSSFVLSIITCVLGLVGNIVVIFFAGFVMKKHKSRIWFLNLAIADMMFLLILPLNAVSVLEANWSYGKRICKMYNFLSIVNMYASIFFITAMTFERFLSVMAPIWHHKFYSPRVSCCTCVAVWAVTVLSSIPALLYSNVSHRYNMEACRLYDVDFTELAFFREKIFVSFWYFNFYFEKVDEKVLERLIKSYCNVNLLDGHYKDLAEKDLKMWSSLHNSTYHYLIPLIIGYIIPLCVIICCNVAIVCKVRTSGTIRSSKLYCMVTVAVMAFFITRTPLVIAQSIIIACLHYKNYVLMTKIFLLYPLLSSIAYVNCCLNPIIYVFLGREVISAFKDLLRRIKHIKATSSCSLPVSSQ